jgi:transcriptional regulator with XRE-family HTH domain
VSQPQLSRLLSGRKDPDLALMEAAARAAGVTPAYFAEWRALKIAALISDLYLRRPNLSIIAVKQMARGARPGALTQAGR